MKLYKCYVKHTEVREGFLFVEAESLESARNLGWVNWAIDEMDWDELPTTKYISEIESAEEVVSKSQVPASALKEYPWYDPEHCHKEERTIGEWVESMTPADLKEGIEWRLEMRARELDRIRGEVKSLKQMLRRRASK